MGNNSQEELKRRKKKGDGRKMSAKDKKDEDGIVSRLESAITQLSKKLKRVEFFLTTKFGEDFVSTILEASVADDVNDYNMKEFYIDDDDDESRQMSECNSDFEIISAVDVKIKEETGDVDEEWTVPSPAYDDSNRNTTTIKSVSPSRRSQRTLQRSTRSNVKKDEDSEYSCSESEDESDYNSDSKKCKNKKDTPKFKRPIEKPTSAACEICSRVFAGRYFLKHLKAHMDTHSLERKYKCPHCPKTYRLKRPLRGHIVRVHEADKRSIFTCEYCPKRFVQATELHRHLRVHTGERPYVCEICGHTTAQKTNMDRHKLKHEDKTILCQQCGKTYRCQISLRSHMKRMHPDELGQDGKRLKPFACDICPSSFHSKDSRQRHLKKMHNIYNPKVKSNSSGDSESKKRESKGLSTSSHSHQQPFEDIHHHTDNNDSQDLEQLEKEINLD